MKKQHIPYTYLIGWTKHNKWYYGVRYAKLCHPSDLWVEYKTSSNYVEEFAKQYGDPDIIQIRKTFSDVNSARKWEEKVLIRMNVIREEKWLNKSNVKSIDPTCVARGDAHWTRNTSNIADKLKDSGALLHSEAALNKIKGSNHYTKKENWDSSTHGMKRPEVKEKLSKSVSGDNHYTHKLNYDNSNHYAKRPEAKEKRAELNKLLFTGYKHKLKSCSGCQREIAANNYPQHLKKCKLFTDLIDSNK